MERKGTYLRLREQQCGLWFRLCHRCHCRADAILQPASTHRLPITPDNIHADSRLRLRRHGPSIPGPSQRHDLARNPHVRRNVFHSPQAGEQACQRLDHKPLEILLHCLDLRLPLLLPAGPPNAGSQLLQRHYVVCAKERRPRKPVWRFLRSWPLPNDL